MTEFHRVLTISWTDVNKSVNNATMDGLIKGPIARRDAYLDAVATIRAHCNVPSDTQCSTLFFALEPNEPEVRR